MAGYNSLIKLLFLCWRGIARGDFEPWGLLRCVFVLSTLDLPNRLCRQFSQTLLRLALDAVLDQQLSLCSLNYHPILNFELRNCIPTTLQDGGEHFFSVDCNPCIRSVGLYMI